MKATITVTWPSSNDTLEGLDFGLWTLDFGLWTLGVISAISDLNFLTAQALVLKELCRKI
jgi:hypothetical protein